MPAYIIADVDVSDPDKYSGYRPLSAAAIQKHGGKFIVRGGKVNRLEGDWDPSRLIVIEFATVEDARAFYNSQEYGQAKKIREGAANVRMIIVEGA